MLLNKNCPHSRFILKCFLDALLYILFSVFSNRKLGSGKLQFMSLPTMKLSSSFSSILIKEGVELAIFEGTNQLQDIPGMYGFTCLTTGNLSNYTQ